MKAKWIGTVILSLTLSARASEPPRQAESQSAKNGNILEIKDAIPEKRYEEWLERAGEIKFDEARVRSQFPPEAFPDFKNQLPETVNSYEEFMELMKRRVEAMRERAPERKAEIGRACPPELFRDFQETVDCQQIRYVSDGLKLRGFILKARSLPAERLPVVIYNHGGNPRVGSLDDAKLPHLTWWVRGGYVASGQSISGLRRQRRP